MKHCILTVMIICCVAAAVQADDFRDLNEQGNKAFEQGNYKDALGFYNEAEIEQPETPEIYYNQANALLKTGQYEEAIEKYDKVLNTSDINLQANAYYNQGSGHFLKGDYAKSIEAFQKVLEITPDDMDAKYNLELARTRLKEQLKRQQQDKGESQDQQEEGQQQQEQQQQEQQKEPQEQQQREEPPQEGEEDKDQQQPQQSQQQQPQPKPDEMSEEDALRILNALEDEEKDTQKERSKKIKIPSNYQGKDW